MLSTAEHRRISPLAEPDGKIKLQDKQSERDHRELAIDKVGVRGLRFPIQIRDKARSTQNPIAAIRDVCWLPKEFRGTHEPVHRSAERSWQHGPRGEHHHPLRDATKLKSDCAPRDGVSVFLVKKAPVSRQESVMDYGSIRCDGLRQGSTSAHGDRGRHDAVPLFEGD
jgi:GTP cyclohydrolase I